MNQAKLLRRQTLLPLKRHLTNKPRKKQLRIACRLFPFDPDAVDYAKCISERHKVIRNKTKDVPTPDEYAITKRVIEHILGPDATDTLIQTYHGRDDCNDFLFKVWKLCGKIKRFGSFQYERGNPIKPGI